METKQNTLHSEELKETFEEYEHTIKNGLSEMLLEMTVYKSDWGQFNSRIFFLILPEIFLP